MKKLRYERVLLVGVILCLLIGTIGYMYCHRSRYYEYQGAMTTYIGTYHKDEKIYTFDFKGFQKDNQYYLSLNDLYNWFVIQDQNAKVYVDYGKHEIRYNGNCINVSKNNQHIYISHKNIYLSVYYIEKILLKNENQIKIENKTAIIS